MKLIKTSDRGNMALRINITKERVLHGGEWCIQTTRTIRIFGRAVWTEIVIVPNHDHVINLNHVINH